MSDINERGDKGSTHDGARLLVRVDQRARRRLAARRRPTRVLSGLGMMGLVGWSVAVPTVLGTWLGVWLDRAYGAQRSWTLTFLIAGLLLGVANAWHWVAREHRVIHAQEEEDRDV